MNKRNYSVNEAEKQELVRISQSVRKEIICAKPAYSSESGN